MAQATIETRVGKLEHEGQDVERRVTYMEQTVIPKIHDELRDFRIEFRTGLGGVRQVLGEHRNVLDEHTKTLGEHTVLLNGLTKAVNEQGKMLKVIIELLGTK
jgi:hypothetical protein